MWRLTSRLAHKPADEDGLIRQILDQLVSPERFLASVRDLYAGSEDEVFDVLHCKDGRVFERYSHPQILGNHPSGRVWSFRDITERLAAEAALRQSEERFRLLAEVSPVGIFSSDPNGRTTFVNRRWCELAGLTPEQALGDGWQTALHPEDRRQVAEAWAEAVRAGESSAAEFRFVRPDGETSWLVGQSRAHRRSDGTLAGYVGTITDVTNLKQAEDEQKRIEAQLRQARKMESLGTLAGGIAHDFNNILNGTFGFIDLARLELEPGHPVNAWLDRMAASSQRARDLVRQILTFSRKSEGERVPQHLHLVVGEALRLLRSCAPAREEWVT
jgi:PAS domain S-box-containing protein